MLTNPIKCQAVGLLWLLLLKTNHVVGRIVFDDSPFDEPPLFCYNNDTRMYRFSGGTKEFDFSDFTFFFLMASGFFSVAGCMSFLATRDPNYPRPTNNIYQNLNALIDQDKLSTTPGISSNLRSFLASIEKSPIRVKNLSKKQSADLEDAQEDLVCSISGSLKDMPVTIYGEPYDFSSVLALEADNKARRIHPKTKELFQLIEVQADRPARETLKELIQKPASTKYPAFFSHRGVREKNVTWSKIAKTIDGEFCHAQSSDERNKVVVALKQFSDYAKERDRTGLYEKSMSALKLLKSRV